MVWKTWVKIIDIHATGKKLIIGIPDSKIHVAIMGSTWVLWAPCWPHEPCYQGYVMVCCLFDVKPLPDPILCCLLDQTSIKRISSHKIVFQQHIASKLSHHCALASACQSLSRLDVVVVYPEYFAIDGYWVQMNTPHLQSIASVIGMLCWIAKWVICYTKCRIYKWKWPTRPHE